MHIRRAIPKDGAAFVALVRALAVFEKLKGPDDAAAARLVADAFADPPKYDLWVAEDKDTVCGYALGFPTYSTFCGGPTYYLEDLFVHPDARRRGIGEALFDTVVAYARSGGYARLDWNVLHDNQNAIALYKKKGASLEDIWRLMRITY